MSRYLKFSDDELQFIAGQAIEEHIGCGIVQTLMRPTDVWHYATKKYPNFTKADCYKKPVIHEIEKYNNSIKEEVNAKKNVTYAIKTLRSGINNYKRYMEACGYNNDEAWKKRDIDVEDAFLILDAEMRRLKKQIDQLLAQVNSNNDSKLNEIIADLRSENNELTNKLKEKEDWIKQYEAEKERLISLAANQVKSITGMADVEYISNPIAKGMTYQINEKSNIVKLYTED